MALIDNFWLSYFQTLIAKQWHFEYSTPKKKKIPAFRTPIAMEDADEFLEIEAPNAPMRKSKSRLSKRKLTDISVALFGETTDK